MDVESGSRHALSAECQREQRDRSELACGPEQIERVLIGIDRDRARLETKAVGVPFFG